MHRDWLRLDGTPFAAESAEFYGLWLLAVLTFGVGDVLTTVGVLLAGHLSEANALVFTAIDRYGMAGLATLKLGAFFLAVSLHVYGLNTGPDDDPLVVYGPPALLAVAGAFATAYNARLLLG